MTSFPYDGKLVAIQRDLARTGLPASSLAKFKNSNSLPELDKYFQKIIRLPEFEKEVFGLPFPRTFGELKYKHRIIRTDFEKEYFWQAMLFSHFSERLTKFLQFESDVSVASLSGNFARCLELLDRADAQCGLSLWSIENRLAALERVHGLQAQKDFKSKVSSDSNASDVLKYFVHFWSYRAEEQVSYREFQNSLAKSLSSGDGAHTPFDEYVLFRTDFFGESAFKHLSFVLLADSNASLFDRYQTWLRIGLLVLARDDLREQHGLIIRAFKRLGAKFDARIDRAVALHAGPTVDLDPVARRFIRALDEYTVGHYSDCIKLTSEFLDDDRGAFEAVELLARAISQVPVGTIQYGVLPDVAQKVLPDLVSVVTKDATCKDAFNRLIKLVRTFPSHRWAPSLFALVMREYRHSELSVPTKYVLFGELNETLITPRASVRLMRRYAPESLRTLCNQLPESATIALFAEAYSAAEFGGAKLGAIGVPQQRVDRYKGIFEFHRKNYAEAIQVLESTLSGAPPVAEQENLSYLLESCLRGGQTAKALTLACDAAIERRELVPRLPIAKIIASMRGAPLREPKLIVAYAVLLFINQEAEGRDASAELVFAYEKLLDEVGVSRPHLLKQSLAVVPQKWLVFFLEQVCNASVMELCVAFASSEEVEAERVAVCQLLSELNHVGSETYNSEIREITQRSLITKGMRAVEQSKIYVDVDGVSRSMDTSLRERFSRYQALGLNMPDDESIERFVLALNQSAALVGERITFVVPKNERLALFCDMFRSLRDKFVSSNEYGLDGYLSVGIRHGTLVGQLRKPLESSHLVTLRDAQDNYKDNEYWRIQYPDFPAELEQSMLRALKSFAKESDVLVSYVKNFLIQIKTEDRNPDALFDFSFTDVALRNIRRQMPNSVEYEEFVEFVISQLWQRTDASLAAVIAYLKGPLNQKFSALFDKLQSDLKPLTSAYAMEALEASITLARTNIQVEIVKIAGWFKRSAVSEIPDFNAQLPADIAVALLQAIHPNLNVDPTIRVGIHSKLAGHNLKNLVEILYILLDNCMRHSGIDDRAPKIEIGLTVNEPNELQIWCKNELSPEAAGANLSGNRLEDLSRALTAPESREFVRREGGTGLHKLKKIAEVDMHCKSTFEVSQAEGESFEITVGIKGEEIFR